MNHSLTILVVDELVKTVGVKFMNNQREYTYKTIIQDLKVGDAVVVEVGMNNDASRGVALATVSNLEPEVNFDNDIEYKWVCASFDMEHLQKLKEQEKKIVDKVKVLELQNKREQLRALMIGTHGAQALKRLPSMITPTKTTKKKGSK